ncbi:hypothetical protein C623_0215530 [Bacillus thuringiensis serovar aizawai str. Hu4-2]|nr:hypothetical protein C623_0215530 [Bacillus thuringiensis serovar aizawai str. Hu4-2]
MFQRSKHMLKGEIMRGKPELKIESEKVHKRKKNPNGMFVARILQIPKEEDKLDFVLILQNKKTKNIIYNKVLVTTDNDYYSFRLARGNIKWSSLYTVTVWDGMGWAWTSISRSISLNW